MHAIHSTHTHTHKLHFAWMKCVAHQEKDATIELNGFRTIFFFLALLLSRCILFYSMNFNVFYFFPCYCYFCVCVCVIETEECSYCCHYFDFHWIVFIMSFALKREKNCFSFTAQHFFLVAHFRCCVCVLSVIFNQMGKENNKNEKKI